MGRSGQQAARTTSIVCVCCARARVFILFGFWLFFISVDNFWMGTVCSNGSLNNNSFVEIKITANATFMRPFSVFTLICLLINALFMKWKENEYEKRATQNEIHFSERNVLFRYFRLQRLLLLLIPVAVSLINGTWWNAPSARRSMQHYNLIAKRCTRVHSPFPLSNGRIHINNISVCHLNRARRTVGMEMDENTIVLTRTHTHQPTPRP